MNAWKEYYLSEFLELNPKVEILNTREYSFVEMPDLEPGRKYVFPSRKRKPNGLTKFQNGDTLFAKITPCLENGKICQVQGLEDNTGVGSTEFFVFRGKENVSDNDFVHYLLKWYPVKKYAEKNMSGSAGHQKVPIDCLHKLKLLLPPYDENKKIGSLLSYFDSNIENLQKQNKTLEKIAQTIFKQWFVDFNFPDENGKPYKDNGGEMVGTELGDIPFGWRVGTLGEIAQFKNGKTSPERSEKSGIPVYGSNGIIGKTEDYNFEHTVIIGRVGSYCGSLYYCMGKCWVTDNAMIGKLKKFNSHVFLFLTLAVSQLNKRSSGSGQPLLNQTILKEIDIILPLERIIESFESWGYLIYRKIYKNELQILTLTKPVMLCYPNSCPVK